MPILPFQSPYHVRLADWYLQTLNLHLKPKSFAYIVQYGGSEAHSTFFQRQRGDWEPATQSRDLMTSIRRFYSNAYTDAEKQDAINLFLGNFVPVVGQPALWELDSDYYLHTGRAALTLSTAEDSDTAAALPSTAANDDDVSTVEQQSSAGTPTHVQAASISAGSPVHSPQHAAAQQQTVATDELTAVAAKQQPAASADVTAVGNADAAAGSHEAAVSAAQQQAEQGVSAAEATPLSESARQNESAPPSSTAAPDDGNSPMPAPASSSHALEGPAVHSADKVSSAAVAEVDKPESATGSPRQPPMLAEKDLQHIAAEEQLGEQPMGSEAAAAVAADSIRSSTQQAAGQDHPVENPQDPAPGRPAAEAPAAVLTEGGEVNLHISEQQRLPQSHPQAQSSCSLDRMSVQAHSSLVCNTDVIQAAAEHALAQAQHKRLKLSSFDKLIGKPANRIHQVRLHAEPAHKSSLPHWLAYPLGMRLQAETTAAAGADISVHGSRLSTDSEPGSNVSTPRGNATQQQQLGEGGPLVRGLSEISELTELQTEFGHASPAQVSALGVDARAARARFRSPEQPVPFWESPLCGNTPLRANSSPLPAHLSLEASVSDLRPAQHTKSQAPESSLLPGTPNAVLLPHGTPSHSMSSAAKTNEHSVRSPVGVAFRTAHSGNVLGSVQPLGRGALVKAQSWDTATAQQAADYVASAPTHVGSPPLSYPAFAEHHRTQHNGEGV